MSVKQHLALSAFNSRDDLKQYESNALLLFALQLKFGIENIHSTASNSLTGGNDDKKADLIYIDAESGCAVIAQAYICGDINKQSASSNKAADLNTAVSWILNRPIEALPECIKSHASELRESLKNGDINQINIWYVHNLHESTNTREELKTVEHTAKTAIKTLCKNIKDPIEIQAIEVGINTLDEWYKSISIPILVNGDFTIPILGGYEIKHNDWHTYFTCIPAKWLYKQFKQYKTELFSANIRDYLGRRNVDRNINNEIKNTAETDPSHFLVYNNGITALVYKYEERIINKNRHICFKGISIVNGAQTTGAIGNLDKSPSDDAMVQVRFIQCKEEKTLYNIVKYNNSQNRITASDFRSNDTIQEKLKGEFNQIPLIKYIPRRGGYGDIIKRRSNVLASVTASQSLAAFHGAPHIAYHKKTQIWEDDTLYSKYFNDLTTAKHILLAYTLQKASEEKKLRLLTKSKDNNLTDIENKQLEFFRKRGSAFLLTAAISNCLEIILDVVIPSKFRLCFSNNISPNDALKYWEPIVEIASSFTKPLSDGLADGFKNKKAVDESIETFQSMIDSTKIANRDIFRKFKEHIEVC